MAPPLQFLALFLILLLNICCSAAEWPQSNASSVELTALNRKIVQILQGMQSGEKQRKNSNRTEQLEVLREQKRELVRQMDLGEQSKDDIEANSTLTSSGSSSADYGLTGLSSPVSTSPNHQLAQFLVLASLLAFLFAFYACSSYLSRICQKRHEGRGARPSPSSSTLYRFSKYPEPFGPDKQFRLEFDEKGLCYASPLSSKEMMPLPNYEEACRLPTPRELLASSQQNTEEARSALALAHPTPANLRL